MSRVSVQGYKANVADALKNCKSKDEIKNYIHPIVIVFYENADNRMEVHEADQSNGEVLLAHLESLNVDTYHIAERSAIEEIETMLDAKAGLLF